MAAPTVFVSYAHYDGEVNYRHKVAAFAERLRSNGIDCHIDQYEENDPPSDWPRWMLKQIQDSDFVLMICTETYCRRVEGREEKDRGRGSRWEGGAITATIYRDAAEKHKFIPITDGPRSATEVHIPSPLDATTSYDMSSEADFDRLLRRLHGDAAIMKPSLGAKPVFSVAAEPTKDDVGSATRGTRSLLIRNNRVEISLHLADCCRKANEKLKSLSLTKSEPEPNAESVRARIEMYEDCVESLAACLGAVAAWGDQESCAHLSNALKLLYDDVASPGFTYDVWHSLWDYPAMFILYAAGTSAMANQNYDALFALIERPRVASRHDRDRERLSPRLAARYVVGLAGPLLDQPLKGAFFPASEYLVRRLQRTLESIVQPDAVELAFDQFEHFLSLALFDGVSPEVIGGRFVYKMRDSFMNARVNEITAPVVDGLTEGLRWAALRSGFFEGSDAVAAQRFEMHVKAVVTLRRY